MSRALDRRAFLASTAGILIAPQVRGAEPTRSIVTGQTQAAEAGQAMLAAGGNAIDAIVTAALVAGVVAVPLTGIGGYGGHLVVAGRPGNKVQAIDFNCTAPAAITPDFFKADELGQVKGEANTFGWLAVGVPGVLAGLQRALDEFGTKKFAEVVQPAIKIARNGFPVTKAFATAIQNARTRLLNDPGSARLLLSGGEPLKEGATFKNPDLAKMLETLAEAGSVAPFYTGSIADQIAAAFKTHGGLLKASDLAAYKPAVVSPLSLDWNGYTLQTPPPTSGGLTVLQTLATLKALGREGTAGPAFVEALRVAWTDRLSLLGDPAFTDVPIKKLLSEAYAQQTAERVRVALRDRKPIEGKSDGRSATGTIHLNAVDAQGMTAAMTFTHGGYLGAQVTVDGLGLILGHGISRFDPRPGRANSPAPGKRPLHNMCPTIVTRSGVPVIAIGATGGRRIVNAVTNVLAYRLGDNLALEAAVRAPRIHAEGDLTLTSDANYPGSETLKSVGYKITTGGVGSLHAVERVLPSGEVLAAAR